MRGMVWPVILMLECAVGLLVFIVLFQKHKHWLVCCVIQRVLCLLVLCVLMLCFTMSYVVLCHTHDDNEPPDNAGELAARKAG